MKKIFIVILIIISITTYSLLFADSKIEKGFARGNLTNLRKLDGLILSAGIGSGLLKDNRSYDMNIAYNIRVLYKWKNNLLSLLYLKYDRFQFKFNLMVDFESEDKYITDLSLLFGHCFHLGRKHSNYVAISCGLGLIKEKIHSFQNDKKSYTVGIPLGLEFSQRIFGVVGCGIYTFGNLNSLESYIGILYNLQLWF